jgi:hypothetical protein
MKHLMDRIQISVAAIGMLASVVGLFVVSPEARSLSWGKFPAIAAVLVAAAAGMAAKYIAGYISGFQKRRRVFLAYSDATIETARQLRDMLRASGIKVWSAEERIKTGDNIKSVVDMALADAGVVVAVLGKDRSDWLDYEITAATERKIPVLPVVTAGASVPAELQSVEHVVWSENDGKQVSKAIEDALRGA